MRLLSILAIAALAASLPSQNWVANGDFSNALTGWTETGFSINPGVETFDVTGLGSQTAYGANHGGQVTPAPYPPNSIKQNVLVVPGAPLEFSMDICVNRTSTGGNADAGTFWVEVGGIEVARVAFGSYVSLEFARARLTTQFVHPTGGNLDLEIFMHRTFLCNTGTPRVRITNVRLEIASGPTFTFAGQRRIGQTSTIGGVGSANAPYLFLMSLNSSPGIVIPGIGGTLLLNPVGMVRFFSGVFDAQGVSTLQLAVPSNANLALGRFHVQGLEVQGGTFLTFGSPQVLQFQ